MRYFRNFIVLIWLTVIFAACESSMPDITSTPPVTAMPMYTATLEPQPSPIVGQQLIATFKYRLFDRFGETFYCDPDFYPIALRDEMELALERFPELQRESGTFQVMVMHLKMESVMEFTNEQKLTIYREYKKLNSVSVERDGNEYIFLLRIAENKNEEGKGKLIQGRISTTWEIRVTKEEPTFLTCPICLAAGTLVDTPAGPITVESLQLGMPIWTIDVAGNRVLAEVLQVSRTPAPASHQVLRIVLGDGRQIYASPRHPTADGRLLIDINVGGELDGARVISATLIEYTHEYTYDVLPSGDTGLYWANGILLGSTIKVPR